MRTDGSEVITFASRIADANFISFMIVCFQFRLFCTELNRRDDHSSVLLSVLLKSYSSQGLSTKPGAKSVNSRLVG